MGAATVDWISPRNRCAEGAAAMKLTGRVRLDVRGGPIGRDGSAWKDENGFGVAAACALLASDEAKSIPGVRLPVDEARSCAGV
jgi:hypothetical protein